MNKVFNPNNIFAFPLKAYDLQNVFFCKELLEERFFCISEDYESSFYRSPNALREAYQVVLEEDVMNYIKKLDKHIYECILFNFLYKIKDELETLSFDEFNKILTDEEIKKEFKNFGVSFDKDDFNEDDFVDKKAEFMQIAEDFYKNENLRKFIEFCADTSDILAVCEKQNIRAYDYASIIALAIIGFEDLYLSQKKYEKIVNFYSKKILSEFNGWDEFIASFMLGELYKNSFEKKEDDEDDEDDYEIISNLRLAYNALTLPYDIFQMSGIWENSVENAKEKLVPILEKRLDKNETHEQKELYEKKRKYYEEECAKLGLNTQDFTQILNIFYEEFYAPFRNLETDYLFSETEKDIITPFTTLKGDDTLYKDSSSGILFEVFYACVSYFNETKRNSYYSLFEAANKFLKRHKLGLKRNDLPIELPLIIFKNALITTKAVYLQSGFLKVKRIAWANVKFSAKVFTFEDIEYRFSSEDVFVLSLNFSDFIAKNLNLRKKVIEELGYEVKALELAFNNLKKRFS